MLTVVENLAGKDHWLPSTTLSTSMSTTRQKAGWHLAEMPTHPTRAHTHTHTCIQSQQTAASSCGSPLSTQRLQGWLGSSSEVPHTALKHPHFSASSARASGLEASGSLGDEEQPQVMRPYLHCEWRPQRALILAMGIPTLSEITCLCSKPHWLPKILT